MKKQAQLGIVEAFEGRRHTAGTSLTSSFAKSSGKSASKSRTHSASAKGSGTSRQAVSKSERRLFALTDVTNSSRSRRASDAKVLGKVADNQASLDSAGASKHRSQAVPSRTELVVRDIDKDYVNTPASVQLVPQYAELNAQFMFQTEESFAPNPEYMRYQDEVTPDNRTILVNWLVEIAGEFRAATETLYLAVSYVDRYLSHARVPQRDLQILGVVCFHIASKYEDVHPPSALKLADITDGACTSDEILHVEASILDVLQFRLSAPTAKAFLQRFIRAVQMTARIEFQLLETLSRYILELSLLDYYMLPYKTSTRAAAALLLARIYLTGFALEGGTCENFAEHVVWTKTLEVYTKHTARELRKCVMRLHNLVQHAPDLSQRAIVDKYAEPCWLSVATYEYKSSIADEWFEPYHAHGVPQDWLLPQSP